MARVHSRRLAITALATVLVAVGAVLTPGAAYAAPAATSVSISSIKPQSGSTVVSGETVTIGGKTSSNLRGKTLAVQVKIGSKWQTLSATPKVSSKSDYSFTTKAIGIGATAYKVVFRATSSLAGAQASRTTTVFKWLYLSDQRVVESKESYGRYSPSARPAVVAGKDYSSAIVGRSARNLVSWSEFNLSFQCVSFMALGGVDDNSSSSSAGSSWVSLDGTTATSSKVTLKLGKTKSIKLNVADSMRLRLSVISPNQEAVSAVWGNARILCSKNVNPQS